MPLLAIALHSLIAPAQAAPGSVPYDAGPVQVLPIEPLDVAIHDRQVVVLNADGARVLTPTGWEDAGLPGGRALLSTGDALYICGADGVTRVELEAEKVSDRPCHDLAPVGDALWILSDDAVYTLDDAVLGLPRRPTLIGGGPQGVWLEGNDLVVDGRQRLVFPGTTDLAAFPTADSPVWYLLHPARQLLGRIDATGLEAAWRLPFAAHALAVGDRDGDGSAEIVVVGQRSWQILSVRDDRSAVRPPPAPLPVRPPPAPTPPMRRPWMPPETVDILGIPFPKFAGLRSDPEYDAQFIGGFGLAAGRGLADAEVPITLSPIASGGIERGAGRVRSFIGADSAPLFIFQQSGTPFIHLAMGSAGFTVGSDRFRMGPFVSAGLIGAAVGARAVLTPFESRIGKLSGLEARLTWFAPYVAHASLAYVNAFPLGRRANDERRPDVRRSFCGRFAMAAGAAGGFSSAEAAWELVGRSTDYQWSGSPAFSVACEAGTRSTGWTLAVDSAPFFFYRVPLDDGGRDRRLFHAGSVTAGPFVGSDRFRVGPIATAGVWTVGGGLRAVMTPFETRQGVWHGLELRATALFPSAPAFQGMALYHVWFDPRARPPEDPETR
jgi:hypothetical protein